MSLDDREVEILEGRLRRSLATLDRVTVPALSSIERPDAWLYAVGVRKLRRAAWRRRLDVLLGDNTGSYAEPDLAGIEASELLSRLTPRQREIVVARYYLGLTFKEIAESFGITVSAATSTVSQGLERIRRIARDSE